MEAHGAAGAVEYSMPPGFTGAEDFLAAFTRSAGGMVAYVDQSLYLRYCNQSFAAWLGVPGDTLIGRSLLTVYGAEAYAEIEPRVQAALAGEHVRYERELHRHAGPASWISVSLHPCRDGAGKIVGLFAVSLVVDALKRTHDALDKAMQVQAFHMENSPLAVIEWDNEVRVRRWSGQAEAIFGWRADEVVGVRSRDIPLVHPDWVPGIIDSTRELLDGRTRHNRMISRNYTKGGRYIYCEWFNSTFVDASGATKAILSLAQDVTMRIEAEEQLRYVAVHDSLTGLQNRQSLISRLEHALAKSRRSGDPLALLFIDLDKFKPVNDSFGHTVGDKLLCEVAARLKTCVREADSVARLGGDEFVVLLETDVGADTPERIEQRVHDSMAQPFEIAGHSLHCTASIGISRYPESAVDADHLLICADQAMYRRKAGR